MTTGSPPEPDLALRRRLASPVASIRAGAEWELWLERRLLRLGLTLERHPELAGLARRPDLRVGPVGRHCYVEATATGGGDLHGHRQATPRERLHDVLMSRLKQKSRAFQGIDAPLVVALLCISPAASAALAHGVADELFAGTNERGRNVSAVLFGWQLDEGPHPCRLLLRVHPRPLAAPPGWARELSRAAPTASRVVYAPAGRTPTGP